MSERVVIPWNRERDEGDETNVVVGYMCMIDFEHEIGAASGGTRVYPSVKDLKRCHTCADECGIVEVGVTFRKIIQEEKHSR